MTDRTPKDATAHLRMRRLRRGQGALGLKRVEVRVPAPAVSHIRRQAADLAQRLDRAAASPALSAALTSLNAPLPHPVTAADLILTLLAETPVTPARPWLRAFFDDSSIELLHNMVLDGVFSFEDLHRAACTWRVTDAHCYPWIREMADLSLARTAWLDAGGDRQPAGAP